jgi:hypothetical protein
MLYNYIQYLDAGNSTHTKQILNKVLDKDSYAGPPCLGLDKGLTLSPCKNSTVLKLKQQGCHGLKKG